MKEITLTECMTLNCLLLGGVATDPSLHHILPHFTKFVVKRERVKLVGETVNRVDDTELF